jgi:hypothetical protein
MGGIMALGVKLFDRKQADFIPEECRTTNKLNDASLPDSLDGVLIEHLVIANDGDIVSN